MGVEKRGGTVGRLKVVEGTTVQFEGIDDVHCLHCFTVAVLYTVPPGTGGEVWENVISSAWVGRGHVEEEQKREAGQNSRE